MSFGDRVVSAVKWAATGRFLSQVVAWGVSIFVMRILEPADYGLLAMATVLTGFVSLFAALGLGGAVIHAQKIDTQTLRQVFGLVIVVNCGLFALVFASAPLVAAFFGEDRLTAIVQVSAVQFLFGIASVVPSSMLERELAFKQRFVLEVSSTIASAAMTLGLALAGFGVWALVWGSLFSVTWSTIGVNLIRPFLQLPSFALAGMRKMFAFGGNVAISRMLLYIYLQADTVIGGRFLGKEQIGYYSVGLHLASLPMQRISVILNEVAFPAFARIQDEPERVGNYLRLCIRMLSLFSFAVFWGIAVVAPEIVRVLLGDKWEPAILPLQLLALLMPLRMIGQLMPPTLQGIGHPGLVARNQLQTCVVLIIAFLIGVRFGIVGLCVAWIVAYPVVFLLNLRTWLPVLRMQAGQLLGAMVRPALAGMGMLGVVTAVRAMGMESGWQGLVMLIVVGGISYVGLSLVMNRQGVRDLEAIFRRRRKAP